MRCGAAHDGELANGLAYWATGPVATLMPSADADEALAALPSLHSTCQLGKGAYDLRTALDTEQPWRITLCMKAWSWRRSSRYWYLRYAPTTILSGILVRFAATVYAPNRQLHRDAHGSIAHTHHWR